MENPEITFPRQSRLAARRIPALRKGNTVGFPVKKPLDL